MRAFALTLLLAALSASPTNAAMVDPRFPDWPCQQIKVPELSVAAMWAGPPIDDIRASWANDPRLKELVAKLAARRTPLEEAEKDIAAFITGSAAEKETKAKLLFAGLFDTLNRERTEVMDGIERFSRRMKEFADTLRADAQALRTVQDAPNQDEKKMQELVSRLEWKTRVFDDRRKTTAYACEVPVLIDQRLFALSRMIQQAME
ncbi:MAG: uncharacterized protein JWN71_3894 [Xanthobacteraceae bacterium]|nr:uncharacterized protein [Xanthobacteraceae bacterium]